MKKEKNTLSYENYLSSPNKKTKESNSEIVNNETNMKPQKLDMSQFNSNRNYKVNSEDRGEMGRLNQPRELEKKSSVVENLEKEKQEDKQIKKVYQEKNKNTVNNFEKSIKKESKKKDKQDKEYKNSYIYGFIFILCSILLEIANFVRLEMGFLPSNFGIEFSIIIMLAGIIFIVPTKSLKVILTSVFFAVQFLLNIINANAYAMGELIVDFDFIINNFSEFIECFNLARLDMTGLIVQIIVLIIFLTLMIAGTKFAPKFKIRKNKSAFLYLFILIFSIEIIGFSSLNIFKFAYFNMNGSVKLVEDNQYWYDNAKVKDVSMKKYGFWQFYINNFSKTITNNLDINDEDLNKLTTYVQGGEKFKYTESTLGSKLVSGVLSQDNLLIITVDELDLFAVDPINTPKLYQFIYGDFLSFSDYVSKDNVSIFEQVTIMGNKTHSSSLSTIVNNAGIDSTYSLAKLFNKNGVGSVNYLNGKDVNFDKTNIGFENIYNLEKYNQNSVNAFNMVSDFYLINKFKSDIMPAEKKFFSFIQLNDLTNNNIDIENNKNLIDSNYDALLQYANGQELTYIIPEKDTKEYRELRTYKAKAIEVEKTLSLILEHLQNTKKSGKSLLENTTIIVSSNNANENLSNVLKKKNQFNEKNNYVLPMAIYSQKLTAGNYSNFCSSFDIYPTICDLYGLEFNNKLIQGNSVFSNDIENSVFVSSNRGIFDVDFYTSTLDNYLCKDNALTTIAKLDKFKNKISKYLTKQQYIDEYYRINYSKKI